jgi:GT2 family glycosyltransferase
VVSTDQGRPPRGRHLHPQELVKIAQAQSPPASEPLGRGDEPAVTVVVLSLDRLHLTQKCLESLYAQRDCPFRLLVFDNGSQPETLAYLRALEAAYKNARVVYSGINAGVAVGRNRAFAAVGTPFIFSLDNDIVLHPGCLREAMACAARRRAGFVAPLRLNPNGTVWAFGAELVRAENGKVLEIARWFHDLLPSTLQSLLRGADLTSNLIAGGAALLSREAFGAC